MSALGTGLGDQAKALREAFDRTFAEPQSLERTAQCDLVGFAVTGASYVLRLAGISGLYADRAILPLPGATGACLGCVAFRGIVAPAYDLQALLGLRTVVRPRWLVLAAKAPVAFAFETFEGHWRVDADAILDQAETRPGQRFVEAFASIAGQPRPIADLDAIIDFLREQQRR